MVAKAPGTSSTVKYFQTTCLLLGLAATAPAVEPAVVVVDDFDDGVQNRLGGYRNTFAAMPSSAKAMRVASVGRGEHGRGARVAALREADGFCGYWVHLFDMRAKEAVYFDASRFGYVSFWVRGETGGEDFVIRIADERWIEKEDSVAIGKASTFLPDGITTEWQEVVVPLDRRHRLDWSRLGGVTFDFADQGNHIVYLDNIAFKRHPAAQPMEDKPAASTAPAAARRSRKLWVWSTRKLLATPDKRHELFDFCQEQQIGEIWTQLIYKLRRRTPGVRDATTCVIQEPDDVRDLLREAHERGIRVHALDGYPDFAIEPNHDIPLAVVDAIIDFNAASNKQERFDGVHFDNEPYLLVGWQDAELRQQILREFLDLNAECQRRVRERSEMEYGIDIPFWWQERDAATGEVVGNVEFRGKRQAASFHCIDLLDNVGVMNYRDTADGADGMIAHGRELLEYADKAKAATVYMGIETFRYRPTPVWFVAGLPQAEFKQRLRSQAEHIAPVSRLDEFRLRTLEVEGTVSVGIELPNAMTPDQQRQSRRTMLELAKHFGGSCEVEELSGFFRQVEKSIQDDRQWSNLRPYSVTDDGAARLRGGFILDNIMLAKTTFADDAYSDLQAQVRAAEQYFSRYKKYGGTAIHYYETFREKVNE